jgi:phosphatidylserine synthase
MRKMIEGRLAGVEQIGGHDQVRRASITGIAWCAIAFIVCTLVSIAPLTRLAGTDYFRGSPISAMLAVVGGWLPVDLHLTNNTLASQLSTNVILFLTLTALSFIAYLLCAWFVSRQPREGDYRQVLRLVWSAAILVGLIFVFAPAMPPLCMAPILAPVRRRRFVRTPASQASPASSIANGSSFSRGSLLQSCTIILLI